MAARRKAPKRHPKKNPPKARAKPRPAAPARLEAAEAARLLQIPPDVLRKHLEAGAPAGPEGRVNLVHYAAWLNQRLAAGPRAAAKGDPR